MKPILFDSSVWISLFTQDVHFESALELLAKLSNEKVKFYVPVIVYMEVINFFYRFGFHELKIAQIQTFFDKNEHIILLYPNRKFWTQTFIKYASHVSLKTLDLLILSFALEINNHEFYSFDRKQINAYYILKKILL